MPNHRDPSVVERLLHSQPNGDPGISGLVRNGDGYLGTRRGADGKEHKIVVTILNDGPLPSHKFACLLTSDDGKEAMGNYADSIEIALGIISPWHNLDHQHG